MASLIMSSAINAFAGALAMPLGYVLTLGTILLGALVGWPLGFPDSWLLGLNLYLSVLAIVIGGAILVSGERDTRAIQIKLDEIVRGVPAADNSVVGVEAVE